MDTMTIPRKPDASWGVFRWLEPFLSVSTATYAVVETQIEKGTPLSATEQHLFRSRKNAERLYAARDQSLRGEGTEVSPDELNDLCKSLGIDLTSTDD